ncbi:MAG: hypothetical protein AB8B95_10160 [Pseudohongiellaceae bacterium]
MNTQYKVLFVCTYWGVRSNIAKSLLDARNPEHITSYAAGFEPAQKSDFARKLLLDREIELHPQLPKSVFELAKTPTRYDYVIALCSSANQENAHILLSSLTQMFRSGEVHLTWNISDFMSIQEEGEKRLIEASKIVDSIDYEIDKLLESLNSSPKKNAFV